VNLFLAALGVLGVASSGPLIAATLGATTVTALAIAFWRNAIAAAVMATPTLVREPRQFGRIGRYEFRWSLVAAVALALHFACFITSLQLTSVAAATALVCLQSAWIAIIQLFRGVRHRWQVLVGLGIAFGGVVAITGFDMGTSPDALLGDLLAMAGGLLAGIYTLAGGRARQSMTTGTYTALCYGMCAVLVAVLALFTNQPLSGFDAGGWLGILAITVCAQLVGHTAAGVHDHLAGNTGSGPAGRRVPERDAAGGHLRRAGAHSRGPRGRGGRSKKWQSRAEQAAEGTPAGGAGR
jgi:drug/metabolite transporter (DMT)-like permease